MTVTDVLSHDQISVQVPIGVAANVCGEQTNVPPRVASRSLSTALRRPRADLPVAFAQQIGG